MRPGRTRLIFFEVVMFLMNKNGRTIKDIERKFDVCQRSAYRYIRKVEAIGIDVDMVGTGSKKDNKYFIASDACPVCGKEHQSLKEWEG
jgi:predicted DNA-binding transcriptional regulator YafY